MESANITRTRKQNADSTYNLRIPLTICGSSLQLRIPQQLNVFIHMSYYFYVDSTKCSGFCEYNYGFHKFAYFWIDFERYNILSICLCNPKHQRRSKKSKNVVDSATNLILTCCGTCSQSTECTVWPRNAIIVIVKSPLSILTWH